MIELDTVDFLEVGSYQHYPDDDDYMAHRTAFTARWIFKDLTFVVRQQVFPLKNADLQLAIPISGVGNYYKTGTPQATIFR